MPTERLAPFTPLEAPIRVLSAVPGRVRWAVSALRERPRLAAAVESDLASHPAVLDACTNAVTATVLVRFDPVLGVDVAEQWVASAIARHEGIVEAPRPPRGAPRPGRRLVGGSVVMAARNARANGVSGGATPMQQLLHVTDPYPELRRRAVAASIADGLADGVPPLLVGLAVGTVTQGSGSLLAKVGLKTVRSQVFALAGLGIAFWAAAALVEYARERTTMQLADRVRRDLRMQLYRKLQTLDIATLESRDLSEWMAIIGNDVDEVARFLHTGTEPLVAMGANVLIVGGTFVTTAPMLGALQLAVIPPLVLASKGMLPPIRARHVEARDAGERVATTIGGNLRGAATLFGFNAQHTEADRLERMTGEQLVRADEATAIAAAYVPTLRSIVGGGFITTLAWGAARVQAGTLTAAGLDTMAYSQLRLMSALARVGIGLESFQRTAAALTRIQETLELEPGLVDGTEALAPATVRGELRVHDVTFGYDPRRPILSGITMHIPAGTTVGIVGPTGAGKSTLLKLLMRFYDPQRGEVTLDGTDIRSLQLHDFRRAVSVVPQEVTLFAGSIHDNIALGDPLASREAVEQAARAAAAHDFIMQLPEGYDTPLGYGGVTLSGGQRQRLAIARALLVDRPVLLFDEATSSLDHATEASIQRSLREMCGGRTTVIVAHRLSTVRHADCIYVLDDGRVVESGRHDDLVKQRGVYAAMWSVQTGTARPREGDEAQTASPGAPAARRRLKKGS